MPTEPSSGGGDDPVTEAPDDELTFAVHDLGRERAPESAPPRDLGFIPARPVVTSPAPPIAAPPARPAPGASPASAADGFVIREADGVAPAAPVDALVVGAPEPVAAPELDTPPADPREAFRINSSTAARAPSPGELWTTRNPAPEPAAEAPATPSRRGWSTRHSEVVDRSAHATMLRLREEAVNVSWKSAWIAVTSCNPRLLRKRSG
jgi:hypothetical protein